MGSDIGPQNGHICKYASDMILTAFDGKFDEKKDEIPPRACRPPNKLKTNNVEKVDHQKVETKQCRKSGSNKVEKQNYVEQVGL